MRTLALLFTLIGTARAETPGAILRGVVVDARSGKPLDEAMVDLCRHAPVDPLTGYEAASHTCGSLSGAPLTDGEGRFELPIPEAIERLPNEVKIVVERIGFMRVVLGKKWLLDSLAKKTPSRIFLSPCANLRGEVRPDGGGAAWITPEGDTVRYDDCPIGNDGRFDCGGMIQPGEVTVFAIERGLVGTARVRLKSGEVKPITVELRDPVFGLQGRVVGEDGEPIAAIVRARPVELSDATLVDRVLLQANSYHTAFSGEFAFLTASRAPVRVTLSTWTQGPLGRTHTGERQLAETIVKPGQPYTVVTLRASGQPIVSCSAVSPDGAELPIQQLNVRLLDFVHDERAHKGRCFGTFAAQPTRQARFLWPQPAQRIEVSVFAEEAGDGGVRKRLEGRVELSSPGEPCRIPVAP